MKGRHDGKLGNSSIKDAGAWEQAETSGSKDGTKEKGVRATTTEGVDTTDSPGTEARKEQETWTSNAITSSGNIRGSAQRAINHRYLPSGGSTTAARRRQRRNERELAAVYGIVTEELRERHEKRAQVLRVAALELIRELRELETVQHERTRHNQIKLVVAKVRQVENTSQKASRPRVDGPVVMPPKPSPVPVVARVPEPEVRPDTDAEWAERVRRFEASVPQYLEEMGTLEEMRSVRKILRKEIKEFKAARRRRRLQQKALMKAKIEAARAAGQAARRQKRGRKIRDMDTYRQQHAYGDVELVQAEDGRTLRVAQLRAVGATPTSQLPTTILRMGERVQEVRLDTCAQYSVAGSGLRKYGQCITREAPVDIVEGFGGGRSRVLGVWRFRGTTRYQQTVVINALVVEGQGEELLLGEDWMVEHRVKLDFGKGELKYRAEDCQKVILPFSCNGSRPLLHPTKAHKVTVRMAKTVKLATNTRSTVSVLVNAEEGSTGIFLPKPTAKRHLLMAPTLSTVTNGMAKVAVLNIEGRREKLPARAELGTWIPTDDTMEILAVNGELERKRVAAWVSTLRKEDAPALNDEDSLDIGDMAAEDRALIVALLRQYAEIVEKKEGCPPLAKTQVQHHINTGDHSPIMMRRRRHAVAENEVIDKEVNQMLENGVIEEGEGAWGFPVVLVRKKDGTVRFCVDYRALNAVTIKDVYPLPRIDETLEALHGTSRYTSLDLHAGYWQLGVAQEDKPKTAFTTRRGLFQFCRMPFGLCNAPSTFQRLMDCVLRGLTWVSCLVYLDDVIIFTKGSVAQHVVELAAVLERLAETGLSLKVSKCTFAATRMEYLGHELTPEGVRPVDRLVTAVRDFPVPRDAAEVRRFVALAGYYRRFIRDFGGRMAPLTRLLRKTTEWEWGDQQQTAFEWAKDQLSQKPVLIYPDYTLPFKLTTDASRAGVGAVLSQDQGRGDQPVAFASKVNSPTVANYNVSELECYAVVWAVRLFRPHLYGRRFTIVTDHVALRWIMEAKELAGRLQRWALALQEYDFEIVYRPGTENRVADALSRGPVDNVNTTSRGNAEFAGNQPTSKGENYRMVRFEESLVGDVPVPTGTSQVRSIQASTGEEGTSPGLNTSVTDTTDNMDAVLIKEAVKEARSAAIYRVEAAELGIVQFTDADIKREQSKSVMVQALLRRGTYQGQPVRVRQDGVICMVKQGEEKVILPAVYWPLAFKEAHDSIWAGHLRGPPTYERLSRLYWWPHMKESVYQWVAACQDCGSRKARPQQAVPPLRSVRTGEVCDRWAIDVAGPLPVTANGNRYVIAGVEYVTRYAVAIAVPQHTATEIAKFLLEKVVMVFGPMREVMMDGAAEFCSKATEELLRLMQIKQNTPVPYRPNLLGLVERFHRTWKDMISIYVNDGHDDWDDFLPSAVYAYNSAVHTTHGFQPNELMMGRKLRSPSELLRRSRLGNPGRSIEEYHAVLIDDLKTARALAKEALEKEQARQAIYYNQRKVRQKASYAPKQLVWVYRPSRGPGITKFRHRWRGPAQVIEPAGYDNYRVTMLESGQELVTHCSFLLPYFYPTNLLETMARDIALDLSEEAEAAADPPQGQDDELRMEEQGTTSSAEPVEKTATRSRVIAGSGAGGAESDQAIEDIAEHANQRPAASQRELTAQSSTQVPPSPKAYTDIPTKRAAGKRPLQARRKPDEAEASMRKKARKATTKTSSTSQEGVYSRTRAQIRRTPYPATDPGGDTEAGGDSPTRARASGTLLPPLETGTISADQPGSTAPGPPATDDEHIYVFAGRGRRGVDSLAAATPPHRRLQPDEYVVEHSRRRYRNRGGRYVMEFEVERVGGGLDQRRPERVWVNQLEYEELWRSGRMRSQRGDDGSDGAGSRNEVQVQHRN